MVAMFNIKPQVAHPRTAPDLTTFSIVCCHIQEWKTLPKFLNCQLLYFFLHCHNICEIFNHSEIWNKEKELTCLPHCLSLQHSTATHTKFCDMISYSIKVIFLQQYINCHGWISLNDLQNIAFQG